MPYAVLGCLARHAPVSFMLVNDANYFKVVAFNLYAVFHLLQVELNWLLHEQVNQLRPCDDIDGDIKLGVLCLGSDLPRLVP